MCVCVVLFYNVLPTFQVSVPANSSFLIIQRMTHFKTCDPLYTSLCVQGYYDSGLFTSRVPVAVLTACDPLYSLWPNLQSSKGDPMRLTGR